MEAAESKPSTDVTAPAPPPPPPAELEPTIVDLVPPYAQCPLCAGTKGWLDDEGEARCVQCWPPLLWRRSWLPPGSKPEHARRRAENRHKPTVKHLRRRMAAITAARAAGCACDFLNGKREKHQAGCSLETKS